MGAGVLTFTLALFDQVLEQKLVMSLCTTHSRMCADSAHAMG